MRELTKEELKLVVGGGDGKNEVYLSGTSAYTSSQGHTKNLEAGYNRYPTKNTSIGVSVGTTKESGQKSKPYIKIGKEIRF